MIRAVLLLSLCWNLTTAEADPRLTTTQIDRAVGRGLDWLRQRQAPDGLIDQDVRATALATLAMLASGCSPLTDPVVVKALDAIAGPDPDDTYFRGVRANVWEYALRLVPEHSLYRQRLQQDCAWLQTAQRDDGAYRYRSRDGSWDNSCTQYALLGLWACARAGLDIEARVWSRLEEHFLRMQNADGGWSYVGGQGSTPAMATAGLASLYLAFDQRHTGQAWRQGQAQTSAAVKVLTAIDRSVGYLAQNRTEDGYYLYGIERCGVAGGRKRFGAYDWFATGAAGLLVRQSSDGSWVGGWGNLSSTAFSLLFFAYGGAPVAFHKLRYGQDQGWNLNPRDLARVTDRLWDLYEAPLGYQVVGIEEDEESFIAPVLVITGAEDPGFDEAAVARLRRYCQRGGTIFAEACDGQVGFLAAMRRLAERLAPAGQTLRSLGPDHGIYRSRRRVWDPLPPLLGVDDGSRTIMFLSTGYADAEWQSGREGQAMDLARNLVLYACDMGRPPRRFAERMPRIDLSGRILPTTICLESSPAAGRAEEGLAGILGAHGCQAILGRVSAPGEVVPRLIHWQGGALGPHEIEGYLKSLRSGGWLIADGPEVERLQKALALGPATLELITAADPAWSGLGLDTHCELTTPARIRIGHGRPPPVQVLRLDGRICGLLTPLDLSLAWADVQAYGRQGFGRATAASLVLRLMSLAARKSS